MNSFTKHTLGYHGYTGCLVSVPSQTHNIVIFKKKLVVPFEFNEISEKFSPSVAMWLHASIPQLDWHSTFDSVIKLLKRWEFLGTQLELRLLWSFRLWQHLDGYFLPILSTSHCFKVVFYLLESDASKITTQLLIDLLTYYRESLIIGTSIIIN